ncbi:MAG: hypothetical protein AMS23_06560 [Bacteroides sp. SM1_62]|nr:MAG: hypothetical protein AMS26_00680 [Bacteroides sp. SM23_62]KPL23499.1 MAG: hypothetical protein AMS23_06560 [Bacteroides sp. SM1_62]
MKEQLNLFLESSQQFLNEIAVALPQIIGALLILLIGWMIARVVKRLSVKGLKLVRFNYLTEKSGIEKFLDKGGVKVSSIDVIGTLIYWIIMLVVILATLNSLKLTAASMLFNQIMLYIPNIIVAIFILVIGIYFARLVSQVLVTSLKNMEEKTASIIGMIANYAIIILTIFIILGQLNIAGSIVTNAFIILFGALCLALGLAFGLGGREWASEIINKYLKP